MWVIFALVAVLFWSVVNLVDKYLLSTYIKNPNIPLIFLSITGLLTSVIIFLIKGFVQLSSLEVGLSLITGVFYVLSMYFYFHALKIEEASIVISLFYLSPLFVLLFAKIFLNELLLLKHYIGIFFLVSGALLLSFKKHFKVRKAFWLMLFANLFMGLTSIVSKYLFERTDFLTIYSYTRFGVFLGVLPLCFVYYSDLRNLFKNIKIPGILFINESLDIMGVFSVVFAISYGFVSLVSALTSVQPLVVLGFLMILSIVDKKFVGEIKEHLKGKNLFIKIISIILIVVGAALVV